MHQIVLENTQIDEALFYHDYVVVEAVHYCAHCISPSLFLQVDVDAEAIGWNNAEPKLFGGLRCWFAPLREAQDCAAGSDSAPSPQPRPEGTNRVRRLYSG